MERACPTETAGMVRGTDAAQEVICDYLGSREGRGPNSPIFSVDKAL